MASGIRSDNDPAFGAFLGLSREIGSDVLKTQGAGGNTSFKRDGAMWVKASGTWLAHAGERDIMVPVTVTPLVAALRAGDPSAEKATDFIVTALNASGLRPSIETSFHAALPQAIVAHYHCVNAIALSVLADRDAVIARHMAKLPDLRWATIPYRRPGTPLACEIDRIADTRPDVLILYNHGIIVTGETVEEVRARITRVTKALSLEVRAQAAADLVALKALAKGSAFHAAEDAESHKTALSQANVALAAGGSLYPDHVIFLGTEIGVLADGETVNAYGDARRARDLPVPKMLLAPGRGVLLANELTAGGRMMARCLAEVVSRIPEGASVTYLTPEEEYELTHWEAEQYRQALDRKASKQA
ncbi:class II aldolase/adducin family protein [Rhizobiaceae bacterium n13]|uniref:Class II aldolase/adducin family protein n=1 Tax=Ferirhizobium litorale TaxID=2927786 RepID=A0AAE3QHT2_9HYPH|nr:class II aldolase/adducin family protein [Fererhizobium litorale]MDI7864139.1 class II aldolase/adducin family protein [Fererhizobium litorale]MDI7923750.1 class II aldolase/adducin family protein [Fererhizobium litorale]